MMVNLQEQAQRFGTDVHDGWATEVDFSGEVKVWINGEKNCIAKR
jgi:thioredoxin reductase (NADPH)